MSYFGTPVAVNKGGTGASTAAGALTSLGAAASLSVMLLTGSQAMTGALNMGTNQIIGVVDPTSAQMAATKNYVDNAIIGINVKTSVRVATTANIALTSTAPNVIDGITLQANDYVLVKNQTTGSQNGIYQVTTLGTGSNGTWTRASGDNVSADFVPGMYVFVGEGSTQGATAWILTTDETIVLGTTSLLFVQFGGGQTYLAGNGLTGTTTFSVLAADTTINVSGSGIKVSATYPGNTSLVTLGTVTTGVWNGTAIAVANGGTGATGASGARSNLSAAPNTPIYWIGATNGELSAGVVPSGSAGVTVNATTGAITLDTSVAVTISGTQTLTNKTMTSPVLNNPIINHKLATKTGAYTMVASDDTIICSAASLFAVTMPAISAVTAGYRYTVKNKRGSSSNVNLTPAGSDTGENSLFSSGTPLVLAPGDSYDFITDGVEWLLV